MVKSERTKERIFQAAFALFEEKGFRKTTIPDICTKAEVSRSTFFHYFKRKSDVLSEYRFSFADHIADYAAHLPEELSGKEKVRALLMEDAEQNLQRGAILRQAIVSSVDGDPEFRASHDRTFEKLPPIYAKVIQESNPNASEEYCYKVALLIVRVFWMIWQSCIYMRDPYDFKTELSDSLDLLWAGVGLE